MQIIKKFCTTREAAQLLGVSLSTAQNWAESGLLDSWKTDGGHRRITRESVLRLLADPIAGDSLKQGGAISAANSLDKFRILVVEDDESLRRIYEIRLPSWSMAPIVDTARDGFDGLVKVGLQQPDLLISDLQMPHLDGFEMIRSLRRMSSCAGMQIVVVTGLSSDDIAAAGGLPPDIHVFSKPVSFVQLEAIALAVAENKARPAQQRMSA